jgi:hypothetical protein
MQAETRLDRVTCMSLGISARGGFQRATSRHRSLAANAAYKAEVAERPNAEKGIL